MSEEKQLQIENLVYRLNMLALERMEKFDELWALEKETTELRGKLVKLMACRTKEL